MDTRRCTTRIVKRSGWDSFPKKLGEKDMSQYIKCIINVFIKCMYKCGRE